MSAILSSAASRKCCVRRISAANHFLLVALRVENARVGQRTNYDKLIIEIETNSALSPEEAIGQAASIIQDQLAVFADFKVLDEGPAPPVEDKDIESMLGRPIEHLDLSVRSMNCQKSDNIFYVGEPWPAWC